MKKRKKAGRFFLFAKLQGFPELRQQWRHFSFIAPWNRLRAFGEAVTWPFMEVLALKRQRVLPDYFLLELQWEGQSAEF